MLCERTELTAGSTWHAVGNVIAYKLDETVSGLNQYGADLYARLEADTGVPSGYHQCGNLRLLTHPDRLDDFCRYLGLALQAGVEARLVMPREIKDLWLGLKSPPRAIVLLSAGRRWTGNGHLRGTR